MQIKIFTIPVFGNDIENENLNRFLRSHRIIDVQQEFVASSNSSYWSFCIKYILSTGSPVLKGKKEKIDYKSVLDETAFTIFTKLRDYRKKIAKEDAVPAYAVFTDAELAEISKLTNITSENIIKIKGIGVKKIEKYGNTIIEMYQRHEKNRELNS